METEDFSHHFPEKELVDYMYEVLVDMDSGLFQHELNRLLSGSGQTFPQEGNNIE
jgi:hypothetical protein